MTTVSNLHDKFFRESFSDPEIAREFLANYLPESVVSTLDLTTLAPQKESFVDAELQVHHSDMLYEVATVAGEQTYIYVLFEHKSYSDPLVAFQLLRYIVRIWEQSLKSEQRLIPILPFVVYHGRERWNVATDFQALVEADAVLRPYIPNFTYHLTDFSLNSAENIRGAMQLQLILQALRHIFDKRLAHHLPIMMQIVVEVWKQNPNTETIFTVLRYIAIANNTITKQNLGTALQDALGAEGEPIMSTIAQEWISEGIEKGIEKGRQEGQLEFLQKYLVWRFGTLPPQFVQRLEKMNEAQLSRLFKYALEMNALEQIQIAAEQM